MLLYFLRITSQNVEICTKNCNFNKLHKSMHNTLSYLAAVPTDCSELFRMPVAANHNNRKVFIIMNNNCTSTIYATTNDDSDFAK